MRLRFARNDVASLAGAEVKTMEHGLNGLDEFARMAVASLCSQ
jgi:hypothetical protein